MSEITMLYKKQLITNEPEESKVIQELETY